MSQSFKRHRPVAAPRPSASVVLISPKNEVLLAKRVRTASSFASAHVFPGGNVDPQDGNVPTTNPARHKDSLAYRNAALRELFEESGILLARDQNNRLISLPADVADSGRKAIHARQINFHDWLAEHAPGAKLDTDNLIPFTHWITPAPIPKRFTTWMFLYLLPSRSDVQGTERLREIPTPTSDGGLEITSLHFRKPGDWFARIEARHVFVASPQYYVLHRLSTDLFRNPEMQSDDHERRQQCALDLANTGSPPPKEMYIGSRRIPKAKYKDFDVLDLSQPGHELEGIPGFMGDSERMMLAYMDGKQSRTIGLCRREDLEKYTQAKL